MDYSYAGDPAGDINLKLGSGEHTTYARVSFKVLALASPVFATMLNPRFSEGQALATSSAGSITTISLPDDDIESVLWLCDALHFNKSITEEISFELLQKFAVVCDKYDLSRALGPWVHVWMEKWDGILSGEECYSKMVWISYAFGHHAAFRRSTREMILHASPENLEIAGNLILPDSVIDSISAERTEALDRLQTTIETIILPHLQHACPAEGQHRSSTKLCEHLTRIGHYLQSLYRLDVWPTAKYRTSNISNISKKLLQFQNYDRSPVESHGWNGVYYGACLTPRTDFKALLKKAAEDAVAKQEGLCLTCVKFGKVTKENGNCHAEKETLCNGH